MNGRKSAVMIRKLDFLWLLAAPVYVVVTTLRHEGSHALAALLEGCEVTDFVILPSLRGGFTFGYTALAGDPGWPVYAAPYFCDLLTFGAALLVCLLVGRIPRWVWLNIVVIGIVGPLVDSVYNYQGGFWRSGTDVARLFAGLPDLPVHLCFAVTITAYLLGLLAVLKYSRHAATYRKNRDGTPRRVAPREQARMTGSREPTAASCREAFLSWARRAAVPLPAAPEEPLGERAEGALDRMLVGKRFVFLGEPDHFLVEKYPFRLLFLRYLFGRGWRHVGMETGRSVGWRVDRYLETGDTSYLSDLGAEPPGPTDGPIRDKELEFIEAHENPFHEQLRRISESGAPGTPRLHYWGYDLDVGLPLGAVAPIKQLLERYADSQSQELLSTVNRLRGLSTDEQLSRIEELQSNLAAHADTAANETPGVLRSWLAFLHDSVAAEKRPRANQDPRGFRRWWAQREHFLMQSLDAIVDGLGGGDKLILLGHNVHLSKDAAHLHLHPQFSSFWGLRSWLRAWGYRMYFKLAGWPTNMGDSVGAHLHRRFPGQVLSLWMLYGQGSLMAPQGRRTVRLHSDTVESLLARVGDRFLLPLNDVDPQARVILSHANVRLMEGRYASTDLAAQADALYFVREVKAE
jgi:hypothetical protein